VRMDSPARGVWRISVATDMAKRPKG
jgi:hypothetical protein